MDAASGTLTATSQETYIYFGGKLIKNGSGYVTPDRLGSIGKFYPYGEDHRAATANDTDKFATYYRDEETGLDYAMNRYHEPGDGRFMTPDPMMSSAVLKNPGSWNRYSYTLGDPVNGNDPSGLIPVDQWGCYITWEGDASLSGPCGGGCISDSTGASLWGNAPWCIDYVLTTPTPGTSPLQQTYAPLLNQLRGSERLVPGV